VSSTIEPFSAIQPKPKAEAVAAAATSSSSAAAAAPVQVAAAHPAMKFIDEKFSWHELEATWQNLVYDILPGGGNCNQY
jgi:hypothetical protein